MRVHEVMRTLERAREYTHEYEHVLILMRDQSLVHEYEYMYSYSCTTKFSCTCMRVLTSE